MLRERLSNFIAAAFAVCLAVVPAAAQNSTTTPAPTDSTPPAQREESQATPDLSITGSVTARELIFRKVPNPRVEFTGRPGRETVWEAERHNLPAEVQPGVTYRDIGITLRIQSIFPDIERIVAEALGEVPASDAAPPTAEPAPPTPPTADTPAPATAQRPRRRPRRGRGQ